MNHAGIQYGQQGSMASGLGQYGAGSEVAAMAGTANTTASLRQWRKKEASLEKQQTSGDVSVPTTESQGPIARVAPHAHYPQFNRLPTHQYQTNDYGSYQDLSPTPVKYSEIVEPPVPPSRIDTQLGPVVAKAKEKEYLEMCNVQQAQINGMKHQAGYPNSLPPVIPQFKDHYVQKESQMHAYPPANPYHPISPITHNYKLPPSQYQRQYPVESSFHLTFFNDRNVAPEPPQIYQMDQRAYQNQRMYRTNYRAPYHPPPMQNYAYRQPLQNQDPYRMHQYQQAIPKYNDYKFQMETERNLTMRRMYSEPLVNYPRSSPPNFNQCAQMEYAQHYQNRRQIPPEYFPRTEPKMSYIPNQQMPDLVTDASPKSSLKSFLENWNDDIPDIQEATKESRLKGPEENLYILDSTEIPSEKIQQCIHLLVDKLPENVKGFLGTSTNGVIKASASTGQSPDSVIKTQNPKISVISETKKFLEIESKVPNLDVLLNNEQNTVIVFNDSNEKAEMVENTVIRENKTGDTSLIKPDEVPTNKIKSPEVVPVQPIINANLERDMPTIIEENNHELEGAGNTKNSVEDSKEPIIDNSEVKKPSQSIDTDHTENKVKLPDLDDLKEDCDIISKIIPNSNEISEIISEIKDTDNKVKEDIVLGENEDSILSSSDKLDEVPSSPKQNFVNKDEISEIQKHDLDLDIDDNKALNLIMDKEVKEHHREEEAINLVCNSKSSKHQTAPDNNQENIVKEIATKHEEEFNPPTVILKVTNNITSSSQECKEELKTLKEDNLRDNLESNSIMPRIRKSTVLTKGEMKEISGMVPIQSSGMEESLDLSVTKTSDFQEREDKPILTNEVTSSTHVPEELREPLVAKKVRFNDVIEYVDDISLREKKIGIRDSDKSINESNEEIFTNNSDDRDYYNRRQKNEDDDNTDSDRDSETSSDESYSDSCSSEEETINDTNHISQNIIEGQSVTVISKNNSTILSENNEEKISEISVSENKQVLKEYRTNIQSSVEIENTTIINTDQNLFQVNESMDKNESVINESIKEIDIIKPCDNHIGVIKSNPENYSLEDKKTEICIKKDNFCSKNDENIRNESNIETQSATNHEENAKVESIPQRVIVENEIILEKLISPTNDNQFIKKCEEETFSDEEGYYDESEEMKQLSPIGSIITNEDEITISSPSSPEFNNFSDDFHSEQSLSREKLNDFIPQQSPLQEELDDFNSQKSPLQEELDNFTSQQTPPQQELDDFTSQQTPPQKTLDDYTLQPSPPQQELDDFTSQQTPPQEVLDDYTSQPSPLQEELNDPPNCCNSNLISNLAKSEEITDDIQNQLIKESEIERSPEMQSLEETEIIEDIQTEKAHIQPESIDSNFIPEVIKNCESDPRENEVLEENDSQDQVIPENNIEIIADDQCLQEVVNLPQPEENEIFLKIDSKEQCMQENTKDIESILEDQSYQEDMDNPIPKENNDYVEPIYENDVLESTTNNIDVLEDLYQDPIYDIPDTLLENGAEDYVQEEELSIETTEITNKEEEVLSAVDECIEENLLEEIVISNSDDDLPPILEPITSPPHLFSDEESPPPICEISENMHVTNAVIVEDNCVLLQIGGEVIEINVIHSLGKKIISVVPYTNCTVVSEKNNNLEETLQDSSNNLLPVKENENVINYDDVSFFDSTPTSADSDRKDDDPPIIFEDECNEVLVDSSEQETEDAELPVEENNELNILDDIKLKTSTRWIVRLNPEDKLKITNHLKKQKLNKVKTNQGLKIRKRDIKEKIKKFANNISKDFMKKINNIENLQIAPRQFKTKGELKEAFSKKNIENHKKNGRKLNSPKTLINNNNGKKVLHARKLRKKSLDQLENDAEVIDKNLEKVVPPVSVSDNEIEENCENLNGLRSSTMLRNVRKKRLPKKLLDGIPKDEINTQKTNSEQSKTFERKPKRKIRFKNMDGPEEISKDHNKSINQILVSKNCNHKDEIILKTSEANLTNGTSKQTENYNPPDKKLTKPQEPLIEKIKLKIILPVENNSKPPYIENKTKVELIPTKQSSKSDNEKSKPKTILPEETSEINLKLSNVENKPKHESVKQLTSKSDNEKLKLKPKTISPAEFSEIISKPQNFENKSKHDSLSNKQSSEVTPKSDNEKPRSKPKIVSSEETFEMNSNPPIIENKPKQSSRATSKFDSLENIVKKIKTDVVSINGATKMENSIGKSTKLKSSAPRESPKISKIVSVLKEKLKHEASIPKITPAVPSFPEEVKKISVESNNMSPKNISAEAACFNTNREILEILSKNIEQDEINNKGVENVINTSPPDIPTSNRNNEIKVSIKNKDNNRIKKISEVNHSGKRSCITKSNSETSVEKNKIKTQKLLENNKQQKPNQNLSDDKQRKVPNSLKKRLSLEEYKRKRSCSQDLDKTQPENIKITKTIDNSWMRKPTAIPQSHDTKIEVRVRGVDPRTLPRSELMNNKTPNYFGPLSSRYEKNIEEPEITPALRQYLANKIQTPKVNRIDDIAPCIKSPTPSVEISIKDLIIKEVPDVPKNHESNLMKKDADSDIGKKAEDKNPGLISKEEPVDENSGKDEKDLLPESSKNKPINTISDDDVTRITNELDTPKVIENHKSVFNENKNHLDDLTKKIDEIFTQSLGTRRHAEEELWRRFSNGEHIKPEEVPKVRNVIERKNYKRLRLDCREKRRDIIDLDELSAEVQNRNIIDLNDFNLDPPRQSKMKSIIDLNELLPNLGESSTNATTIESAKNEVGSSKVESPSKDDQRENCDEPRIVPNENQSALECLEATHQEEHIEKLWLPDVPEPILPNPETFSDPLEVNSLPDECNDEHNTYTSIINTGEDLKLHIKKIETKKTRKKRRFRNLHSCDSETEESPPDYSVFESENQHGLPKLIIKRNVSETRDQFLQPVVRIERDVRLDNLAKRKRKA